MGRRCEIIYHCSAESLNLPILFCMQKLILNESKVGIDIHQSSWQVVLVVADQRPCFLQTE